jgi:hypothetical protein
VERREYRITLKGRLSERFTSAFDSVTPEPGVRETVLLGRLDQSQLYGLIARLSDLGLELVRVERVEEVPE